MRLPRSRPVGRSGLLVPDTEAPEGATIERVAAFDVDGTITRHDCVVPFVRRIRGLPRLGLRALRHPIEPVRAAIGRDRDAMKAVGAIAAFEGEFVDRIDAAGVAFARDVIRTNLRDDVVTSLRTHLADGDTVVLVSASFEVYLRPLAAQLGAEHVLGTRLESDGDGHLTGRLDGPNCRGPEKVRRLHEWLDVHAGGRQHVHLTAYGDSSGDRELLIDADVARWVGKHEMPSSWMAAK